MWCIHCDSSDCEHIKGAFEIARKESRQSLAVAQACQDALTGGQGFVVIAGIPPETKHISYIDVVRTDGG